MPPRIVEELELRIYDDGTGNLNFWNIINGNDVVADISKDNKLSIDGEEITFSDYVERVKESVKEKVTSGF